jgi:hypothetical protein
MHPRLPAPEAQLMAGRQYLFFVIFYHTFPTIIKFDNPVKSLEIVMPDLIRHPERIIYWIPAFAGMTEIGTF